MNKLSVFAAVLVFAGAAAAQTQALTREAVVADLVAARASGELAALQAEKGVDVISTARATAKLPAQYVHANKSTSVAQVPEADHGENAARELGDFSAPVIQRRAVLAGR